MKVSDLDQKKPIVAAELSGSELSDTFQLSEIAPSETTNDH